MPARVVEVHDDPTFADPLAALLGAGQDVALFTEPMTGLDSLDTARTIDSIRPWSAQRHRSGTDGPDQASGHQGGIRGTPGICRGYGGLGHVHGHPRQRGRCGPDRGPPAGGMLTEA